MHYDDGHLMEYLDGEATAEQRAAIAQHLAACGECERRTRELAADRGLAADALSALQPAAEVVPLSASRTVVPAARVRVAAAPRRTPTVWRAVAGLAAVAVVLALFAFAPVRTAAANLLQVFRVQKVATVTITQEDLAKIQQTIEAGNGHVDLKAFGEVWVDGSASEPTSVTVEQAQAALDFPVKLPADQPSAPTLMLTKAQTYRFKLHVSAINEALKSYGATTFLPQALDGKTFEVKMPAVLVAEYPAPEGVTNLPRNPHQVFVGQARSPQLIVPDGVDAAQLRDVLLNLPFLPENVRTQLAAVDDWQSTLIIPNVDGTAHDVTIDGVPAVVISPKSAARAAREKMGPLPDSTTVVWNDNGVVRAVGGPYDEEKAIALAKSTMK